MFSLELEEMSSNTISILQTKKLSHRMDTDGQVTLVYDVPDTKIKASE